MTAQQADTIERKKEAREKKANIGRKERWLSMVGGGALALYGLTRRSRTGKALALLGSSLFYRGKTGYSRIYGALGITRKKKSGEIEVERSITVRRSPEEIYNFWRDIENLPKFMENVKSVKYLGDGKSHWVAKTPIGTTIEWDAEVTRESENAEISWHSLPGSEIENGGTVKFKRAPGDRGTVVTFVMYYRPPGGAVGAGVAKLLNAVAAEQIENDLRRFKQVMEAGETAAAG